MSSSVWFKRMQDLARGAGFAHAPLFAPLLFGAAAQIEAIAPEAMAQDGTRLRKNMTELRRALGLETVACAVPSAMEAQALGVPVAENQWPPRPSGELSALNMEISSEQLLAVPRIAAALEAIQQWRATPDEQVIVAALTGPATLLAQLRAAGAALTDEEGYDLVGRTLATLARMYAEAQVQVLQLHETELPGDEGAIDGWKGALGTIGNVSRFHRVPPLLVVEGAAPASWPVQVVACPGSTQTPVPPRPHGQAWASDPVAWPSLPTQSGNLRLITTVAEVPASTQVSDLVAAMGRIRS
ncbi:MAG: hypothetical protein ABS45_04665 [Comamonas sp. SCN 65-56]|uniref:hypothetical protein n=1 Tax=Comamonas sp. SCN 65-56 TaxID=1660095 RepID=UPI000868304C|nr:hypothetical protein [Comamonas sp. SCN 65-56]ODS92904.1 MAG: hypothetical protein ABS45_04665 [Comamonas sp. SCN 65-56]